MRNTLLIGLALALVVSLRSSAFIVYESTIAIVTQFGEIRGNPIDKAGLHFKMPFVQDVRVFDKRILTWDGDEEQIPTKDKKYIWVDTTARWKIIDAKKFAENLQNERQAKSRLDSILDGITRDTISSYNLVEAVRNSNTILTHIQELRKSNATAKAKAEAKAKAKTNKSKTAESDTAVPDEASKNVDDKVEIEMIEQELIGDLEPVQLGREKISQQIAERASIELQRFGIELIDVQLRRIAYEKSVEEKVYERMISERNRIAEKIRSIGKGEEAKIIGKLNKDLKEIESGAYRQAQEIRGDGDATAAGIFAKVIRSDPEFYDFVRSLEAYEKIFPAKGDLVLSNDSKLLKLLR